MELITMLEFDWCDLQCVRAGWRLKRIPIFNMQRNHPFLCCKQAPWLKVRMYGLIMIHELLLYDCIYCKNGLGALISTCPISGTDLYD